MKDLESRLAELGKRDKRNTHGHTNLGKFLIDKDNTPCELQSYPFCNKSLNIHYTKGNVLKNYAKGTVHVRCQLCGARATVLASQWLKDKDKSKKSE